MSKYQENQRKNAPRRLCFNDDSFNGVFRKIKREFVLANWKNNFYQPILTEVVDYFKSNNISWWNSKEPTGNILSSQIACLNHLFAIRKDSDAILAIAKTICNDIEEVLPIPTDNGAPGFVSFEVVSSNDWLQEGEPTRGSKCTSIDALILAKDKKKKTILIPIEWKYTEYYSRTDKSIEDGKDNPKGSQKSGKERLRRYSDLITKSAQLKYKYKDYKSTIYFLEPFYQLMRQTLWTEQVKNHEKVEKLKVDDFIHVFIAPDENHDLLKDDLNINKRRKGYVKDLEESGNEKSLEEMWRSCLIDDNKFKILSPQNLLANIDKTKHECLINYLSERYWKA